MTMAQRHLTLTALGDDSLRHRNRKRYDDFLATSRKGVALFGKLLRIIFSSHDLVELYTQPATAQEVRSAILARIRTEGAPTESDEITIAATRGEAVRDSGDLKY